MKLSDTASDEHMEWKAMTSKVLLSHVSYGGRMMQHTELICTVHG